ncbi:MAG: TIM barrel protein [bacterium]|jgi:sugar phosphate isomerase/epimerase
MPRTVKIDIGVNGAFITRRWEKPENWMRLTRECGYEYHSFCADVLDPFFSGDRTFQAEIAGQTRDAAAKYGVKIIDIYTGMATHRFHGLSHTDPRARRRMAEWLEGAAEIAAVMGTDAIGGHVDAFSTEVLEDPEATEQCKQRLFETMRNVGSIMKRKGMRVFSQEQMYIPSEKPWLISEGDEFLVEVNRTNTGQHIYLTLDTGHMAGQPFGAGFPDTDYLSWMRRFSSVSEVIHVQQTVPDASHHWPFLPKYNEKGCVNIPDLIDAIKLAHREHDQRPFSFMQPVSMNYLVLEVIPGSTKRDDVLLSELKESARYLRQFIPEGGLTFEV